MFAASTLFKETRFTKLELWTSAMVDSKKDNSVQWNAAFSKLSYFPLYTLSAFSNYPSVVMSDIEVTGKVLGCTHCVIWSEQKKNKQWVTWQRETKDSKQCQAYIYRLNQEWGGILWVREGGGQTYPVAWVMDNSCIRCRYFSKGKWLEEKNIEKQSVILPIVSLFILCLTASSSITKGEDKQHLLLRLCYFWSFIFFFNLCNKLSCDWCEIIKWFYDRVPYLCNMLSEYS